MTATEVPTIQTESSPPYAPSPAPRRRRRVLLGAALAVLAAVALIAWLLAMSSVGCGSGQRRFERGGRRVLRRVRPVLPEQSRVMQSRAAPSPKRRLRAVLP
jgi:hypothetical protein